MADKKPLVLYGADIKELASTDTIPVVNGGVDQNGFTSYTPTLSNMTLGNGTLVCKYKMLTKKTCLVRFVFVLGSTSTVGTTPAFTFPFTSVSTPMTQFPLGVFGLYNNTTGLSSFGIVFWTNTSGCAIYNLTSPMTAITATVPFTWAANFAITGEFIYEIA